MDIKKFYRFFSSFILILSVCYFGYFIINNAEQFKNLRNIAFQGILIIFLLKVFNVFFLSNINLNILKNMNIYLSNKESLDVTVKNTLGNLSSPFKLGSGYKLTYLKSKYDFKIKEYIFWSTFYAVINLYPLYLIFIIFSFLQNNKLSSIHIFFIIFLSFSLFFLPVVSKNKKVKTFFNLKENFYFLSKVNFIIQLNNILFFLSTSLIVLIIIQSYDEKFSLFSSISYSFLSSFINLINITPGNIGAKEGLIILFNQTHGIGLEIIIVTSFIERLTSLITLFVFQILLNKTKN
tara:strand:+ start:3742 stop:4620 length:879 start_codon:yes stop_codon:yes gene_type:complete